MRKIAGYVLSMLFATTASGAELPSYCRKLDHADGTYTVCSFDPKKSDIRLYHADYRTGEAYGSFLALSSALWRQHQFVVFAMNGGMYHGDMSPVGLFIEARRQAKSINTNGGWGNFHMQPNGVFFIDDRRAGVLETNAYLKARMTPDFATQSGPMLVIDGKIHPQFKADSDSYKRRNGVGVSPDGIVHFAISEDPVRFYDFATLFRDELHAANALFLDGTISSVNIPAAGRRDALFPIGPIIAVVERVPDL